jgi:hypothetical protein
MAVRFKVGIVAVAGFAVVLSFQNCTATKTQSTQQQQQAVQTADGSETEGTLQASDNGFGYDGKPYVREILSQPCGDGTAIHDQINLMANDTAVMVKSSCQIIRPQTLAAGSWTIPASNPNILIYENQTFEYEAAPPTSVKPLHYFCMSLSQNIGIMIFKEGAAYDGMLSGAGGASALFTMTAGAPATTYAGTSSTNDIVSVYVPGTTFSGMYFAQIRVDYSNPAMPDANVSGFCVPQ